MRACLEAIARQTARPFEVIVVDNNSTDATAAIARTFPFVRLLREEKQGPVHARDCGFDAARGEIIGRLDADSVIEPDWVETVQKLFADPNVDAASGTVRYHEVCARSTFDSLDFYFRSRLARRAAPLRQQTMQGVNMAIRASVWREVRTLVCRERQHHEDLDLAAHLAQQKCNTVFEPRMVATVTFRQADAKPLTFYHYVISTPRTYRLHGLIMHRYMYLVAWLVLMIYLPIRIAYRGYDPTNGRFSWRCLLAPQVTTGRVSPIASSLGPAE